MHERENRKDSIRDVVIFSLATPVMIIVAFYALSDVQNSWIGLAMLFSAGTFLYVATVDTLPDIHNSETGRKAMIYVILGILIMASILIGADALGIGHSD
jgi:zinc transporter ZupT